MRHRTRRQLLLPDTRVPDSMQTVSTADAWRSALTALTRGTSKDNAETLVTGLELSNRQGFDPRSVDTTAFLEKWPMEGVVMRRTASVLMRTTFNVAQLDTDHRYWLLHECDRKSLILGIAYLLRRIASGQQRLESAAVEFGLAAFERLREEIGGGGMEDEVIEGFSFRGLSRLLNAVPNFGPEGLIAHSFIGETLLGPELGVAGLLCFLNTALYGKLYHGDHEACTLVKSARKFQDECVLRYFEALGRGVLPENTVPLFDSLSLNNRQADFLSRWAAAHRDGHNIGSLDNRKAVYAELSLRADDGLSCYDELRRFFYDGLAPQSDGPTVSVVAEALCFAPRGSRFGAKAALSLSSRLIGSAKRKDLPYTVRARAAGAALRLANPGRFKSKDDAQRAANIESRAWKVLSSLAAENPGVLRLITVR